MPAAPKHGNRLCQASLNWLATRQTAQAPRRRWPRAKGAQQTCLPISAREAPLGVQGLSRSHWGCRAAVGRANRLTVGMSQHIDSVDEPTH
eukprot:365594-Chlamydomonas_euryale.AAC.9